jgi:enterochelin esterase-like enzyme
MNRSVESAAPGFPALVGEEIMFSIDDPAHEIERAALWQEVERPRLGPEFHWTGDGSWKLRWPPPPAARIEYLFSLTYKDGRGALVCDPGNAARVPGPWGYKSVLELPSYKPPLWLHSSHEGKTREGQVWSPTLGADMNVAVWAPDQVADDEPVPLLVVHDGFDYARYSSLLKLLGWLVSSNQLSPMRAALLSPIDRDAHYSASALYSTALAHDILPVVATLAPTPPGRKMRAGLGASLGALAMLHCHRNYPATFGALFLQSGSFFQRHLDPQESSFAGFEAITSFMGKLTAASDWAHTIPVTLTCGSIEENLANNRDACANLQSQDYDAGLVEYPDAHNWVSWRDSLHPHLSNLLRRMWS